MGVQTDLKAGTQCFSCGYEIEFAFEMEIEVDLFGNCRPKHRSC